VLIRRGVSNARRSAAQPLGTVGVMGTGGARLHKRNGRSQCLHTRVLEVGGEQRWNGVVQFIGTVGVMGTQSVGEERRQDRGVIQFWGWTAPKCTDECSVFLRD
jgi:hypothetical protein